jgi:hypothetical protein
MAQALLYSIITSLKHERDALSQSWRCWPQRHVSASEARSPSPSTPKRTVLLNPLRYHTEQFIDWTTSSPVTWLISIYSTSGNEEIRYSSTESTPTLVFVIAIAERKSRIPNERVEI